MSAVVVFAETCCGLQFGVLAGAGDLEEMEGRVREGASRRHPAVL